MLQALETDDFGAQRIQLSHKITFSLDSEATCFFMKNYVVGNSRSFDYLQSFYDSGMEEHLSASVKAVALATFSCETQSWELEQKALREYTAALRALNDALVCSEVACNDDTLISVILLDQFEKILSRRRQRPAKSRTKHINGATSLVRLRGYKQFQSQFGLRIFLQISSAIMVSCMQDGTAVPPDITALRAYATNFLDADDPIWRISQTFIRLVNLYAALKDDTLFEPTAIITEATHIDEECVKILVDLNEQMSYRTIHTTASDLISNRTETVSSFHIYEGYYHIYPSYRIAQAWNSVRLGRILLNEVIREQYTTAFALSPAIFTSTKHIARFQLVTDNIAEMSSHICASVPRFTHGLGTPPSSPQALTHHSPEDSTSAISSPPSFAKPVDIAGAYSLLFPLFVVAYSPTTPEEQRTWILEQMDFIGQSMQTQQADMCTDILRRRKKVNVWDIYAVLGSYVYPDRME